MAPIISVTDKVAIKSQATGTFISVKSTGGLTVAYDAGGGSTGTVPAVDSTSTFALEKYSDGTIGIRLFSSPNFYLRFDVRGLNGAKATGGGGLVNVQFYKTGTIPLSGGFESFKLYTNPDGSNGIGSTTFANSYFSVKRNNRERAILRRGDPSPSCWVPGGFSDPGVELVNIKSDWRYELSRLYVFLREREGKVQDMDCDFVVQTVALI